VLMEKTYWFCWQRCPTSRTKATKGTEGGGNPETKEMGNDQVPVKGVGTKEEVTREGQGTQGYRTSRAITGGIGGVRQAVL